jgi:hypothetical protein
MEAKIMIDQPTHYTTEEGGDWISFPISLFRVSDQDIDIAPPEELYEKSKVIWLESHIFPGMFLKVHSLKWSDETVWNAYDCTIHTLEYAVT